MKRYRKNSHAANRAVVKIVATGKREPDQAPVVYEFEAEDDREVLEIEREIQAKRLMERIEAIPPCDRQRALWAEIIQCGGDQGRKDMLESAALGAARMHGYPAVRLLLREFERGFDPTPFVLALLPDRHPLLAFAQQKRSEIEAFAAAQASREAVLNEARAAVRPADADIIDAGMRGWRE